MGKKKFNWVDNEMVMEPPVRLRMFHHVDLPSDIGGECWTTSVEEGQPLEVQCVGPNAAWGIHLTRIAGEDRFEVEADAWDVDVSEVLPKVAQVVREQVSTGNNYVRLKLVVTY